ncbi:MAG: hypothetical protein NVS3B12_21240 [Acidimicrobiales bacterium]
MLGAGVVLIAAGLVVVGVATSGGQARPPVASAVAFGLPPVVEGGTGASLAAVPGRPVVLSFFASWCEPCRRELPLLAAEAARAGAPEVIGIDFLDQRADALDLLGQTRVTFPTGYDHDGEVGRRWGVDGLPVTVFIAPGGRVVAYHRGELRRSELSGLVRRLEAAGR